MQETIIFRLDKSMSNNEYSSWMETETPFQTNSSRIISFIRVWTKTNDVLGYD